MVIAVGNDRIWAEFCRVINREDLALDPRFRTNQDRIRNREELARILNEVFSGDSAFNWASRLMRHGIPAAPILNVREALESDYAKARGSVINQEKLGMVIRSMRNPLSLVTHEKQEPPPILGEHTQRRS
jgi:crotonobetainyl-CoA:carnitine CoA-transferase CaiB-like acyl-CoA transferase